MKGESPCEYDYLKPSIVCIPLQLVLMKSFTPESVAPRSHKTFAQFLLLFFFFLVLICHIIGNASFLIVTSAHAYFIHFNPKKHQYYLFMKANTISNEVQPICLHQAGDPQQCLNLKLILSKMHYKFSAVLVTKCILHNCTP